MLYIYSSISHCYRLRQDKIWAESQFRHLKDDLESIPHSLGTPMFGSLTQMKMTLANVICHEPHTLFLDDFCRTLIQATMAALGKIELEVIH